MRARLVPVAPQSGLVGLLKVPLMVRYSKGKIAGPGSGAWAGSIWAIGWAVRWLSERWSFLFVVGARFAGWDVACFGACLRIGFVFGASAAMEVPVIARMVRMAMRGVSFPSGVFMIWASLLMMFERVWVRQSPETDLWIVFR